MLSGGGGGGGGGIAAFLAQPQRVAVERIAVRIRCRSRGRTGSIGLLVETKKCSRMGRPSLWDFDIRAKTGRTNKNAGNPGGFPVLGLPRVCPYYLSEARRISSVAGIFCANISPSDLLGPNE